MKRNLFNKTAEQMVGRYIRCLAFLLKYSDRAETIQRFKGFVDGLAWSHFITPDEQRELFKIVESYCKSIIRYYRKEGILR